MTKLISMQHLCTSKFRPVGLAFVVALFILITGPPRIAYAATVSFTAQVTAAASVSGSPSPGDLTLPTTIDGSALFVPFGPATYTEVGLVTYVMLPSGNFVPASVMNNFLASFSGGGSTFRGTNAVVFGPLNAAGFPTLSFSWTILGGTGVFSGATGSATGTGQADPPLAAPGEPQNVSFATSNGQITAPGLTAVPEPGTIALFAMGMTGLAGLAMARKRRSS